MTWLDNISTEKVFPEARRYSRPTAALTYQLVENGEPYHNGFTYEYAHKTKLEVYTVWYANQAQWDGRARQAERALLEVVFAPYTAIKHRLLMSITQGDDEEAFMLLNKMEQEMGLS